VSQTTENDYRTILDVLLRQVPKKGELAECRTYRTIAMHPNNCTAESPR